MEKSERQNKVAEGGGIKKVTLWVYGFGQAKGKRRVRKMRTGQLGQV